MRTFNYQALTKDEQLLTGLIAAHSAAAALEQLESQGLTVLLLRQEESAEPPLSEPVALPPREDRTAAEPLLRERLAALVEQRATLAPAIAAFAEELPRGRARRDLLRFTQRLQSGSTADDLLRATDLAHVWLPLIGTGSPLDSSHLQDVFAEAEREYANRAQTLRMLAYPVIVVVMALAVLVLLGIWVVPTFESIFRDFDMRLPGLTVALVEFSHVMRYHPLLFLLGLAVTYLAVIGGLRILKGWFRPGRWLGIFFNGNSQQVAEMATFVQHLAEALNVGLPLGDALRLAGGTIKHRWLRREAEALSSSLVARPHDVERIRQSPLPATVVQALVAGPQGTPHVRLLQGIADSYFERVRNRFRWSTGFLPQFAILLVGIVVGLVVLGLFLPLVQLINGLSG